MFFNFSTFFKLSVCFSCFGVCLAGPFFSGAWLAGSFVRAHFLVVRGWRAHFRGAWSVGSFFSLLGCRVFVVRCWLCRFFEVHGGVGILGCAVGGVDLLWCRVGGVDFAWCTVVRSVAVLWDVFNVGGVDLLWCIVGVVGFCGAWLAVSIF